MNREQADKLIDLIRANTNADPICDDFVPFKTSSTTGYIPAHLVDYFIETGDFEYDGEILTFAEGVDGFETKSAAMIKVRDAMVEAGAVRKKPEHYAFEGLAIGGNDRQSNPEFEIDGFYYYEFGLKIDAVSLQITTQKDGQDYLLLSRRSDSMPMAAGTIDFMAGGTHAIKHGNSLDAVVIKAKSKSGLDEDFVRAAKHIATTNLSLFSQRQSQDGNAFQCYEQGSPKLWNINADSQQVDAIIAARKNDPNQVSEFMLATPSEVIDYCLNGQIHPVMVQSFVAALTATDLIPQSEFLPEIKAALAENNGCVFTQQTPASKRTPKGVNL